MITLYSNPTANGQKVHIMLEAAGLAYQPVLVDLKAGEHRQEPVTAANPMGRIPAIVDPEGPDGSPIMLGETAAIVFYLMRKTGRFGPENLRETALFDYWVHAISASLAPAFAMQFYFTALAPEPVAWAAQTFADAARRMLGPFEARLGGQPFLAGARFTALDMLLYPHLATSAQRLPDGLSGLPALQDYAARIGARADVQRGMRLFLEA